jgi:hypothetical protein
MAFRWNEPGRDPYTGDKAAAVRRLTEIPAETRETLALMVEGRFSAVVTTWTREGEASGRFGQLADMNFGQGRIVPGPVDVSGWPPGHREGAMVFAANGYAVAWFARCGNIARVVDLHAPAAPVSAREAHAARLAGGSGLRMPGGQGGGGRAVPEPAGWLLTALAVLLAVRGRRQ